VIDLRLADMANGTFRRTLEASQHHLNHLPSSLSASSLTEGFRRQATIHHFFKNVKKKEAEGEGQGKMVSAESKLQMGFTKNGIPAFAGMTLL